ncbi:MAG: DUF2147 domain-containing protein [Deltaproteobacteria bacterium]|nr:MAG: DUF2147 domain-containing protein [Deltaproteobacteria bacterium]
MIRFKIISLFFLSFLFISVAYAFQADDILGKWITTDKDAIIEFYKCGNKYCGKIVWAKDPDKKDIHNPNPALRNRTLLGATILEGFVFNGKDEWVGGRIYNPDDGKKYKCKLTMDSENVLKVRGYLLVPFLGKTVEWKRISEFSKYNE